MWNRINMQGTSRKKKRPRVMKAKMMMKMLEKASKWIRA